MYLYMTNVWKEKYFDFFNTLEALIQRNKSKNKFKKTNFEDMNKNYKILISHYYKNLFLLLNYRIMKDIVHKKIFDFLQENIVDENSDFEKYYLSLKNIHKKIDREETKSLIKSFSPDFDMSQDYSDEELFKSLIQNQMLEITDIEIV